MDELVAGAFVFHPLSGPVEIMSVDDWLDSKSPTGSWDSDEETARLERIAMYSSVEEYDRYEGEDS